MIHIHSLLQRGISHKLACQDSVNHIETDDYIFAGVFDGCSEIKDSHFASNLLNKTFKKAVENQIESIRSKNLSLTILDVYDDLSIKDISIEILDFFFKKLDTVRLELNLTVGDFSSTCILFFFDKISEKGIVYMFGDGVLYLNEQYIKIDHDNKPKYIIYYWKDLENGKNRLLEFLNSYDQIWEIDKLENVVLSTDGILTFKNLNNIEGDIINDLVESTEINGIRRIHQSAFFDKKYNVLSFEKWIHSDDLGLVRIYNEK